MNGTGERRAIWAKQVTREETRRHAILLGTMVGTRLDQWGRSQDSD